MGYSAVLPILVVLGLLGGFLYLVRRQGISSPRRGAIQIVDRVVVDAKTSLLLVEFDGRRLLIGSSAEGLTNLCEAQAKAAAHGSGS